MKNLLPVITGVVLCVICTIVGILVPRFSALAYITVSLACVSVSLLLIVTFIFCSFYMMNNPFVYVVLSPESDDKIICNQTR